MFNNLFGSNCCNQNPSTCEVVYEDPKIIMEKFKSLEKEILKGAEELEQMLNI